ncbi:UDP-glycosyltransferase 73C6-like [Impatiens glandulifera]|uniref:UDP-glycosyltransferase 73C6-like n=1 Tax=Impatiens glandulifera TaxID=253017 RepID=UPI001FB10FF6|nr:UDP-glycosyltransferase 73C6-like [Impatiens glandulifera]
MASKSKTLHFILFPLMAQGHMIPMVDIAQSLAKRNILVTIITTPINAKRFEPTFSKAKQLGLKIQIQLLNFPSQEAGLPEGCENIDMLPSLAKEWYSKFFTATAMLNDQFESTIEKLNPKPSCIISDMGFPWTVNIAQKFSIPRIIFHGTCLFSLVCFNKMILHRVRESVESEFDVFVIPDLPHKIELTKAQLPGPPPPPDANLTPEAREAIFTEFIKSEKGTYGTIVNSFTELEPDYVTEYSKIKGDKVWCVGPVSIGNRTSSSTEEHTCLKWLDLQNPGSVIYVCLGSISRLNTAQMIELSLGIEASKRPFIWVARTQSIEFEEWMIEQGFEERNRENGLVIKGWAPQVSILSHSSVGGFFTHCGWNSILEGVCAGLAMITWPMFAEQFLNEKLVVQVLEIGLSVGVKMGIKWGDEDKVGVLVEKEIVEKRINELMDEGEEGEKRRERARELGEMAKKALDDGGSSHLQMTKFIEDIMEYDEKKMNQPI